MTRIGKSGPLEHILEKVSVSLDTISAKLLLQEAYESMYAIFDHEMFADKRPLALVAMHPKENVTEYSKLYRTVYRYTKQNIKDLFGLNLKEFLDLPHEMVELLFKIAFEQAKKGNATIDKALEDLDRSSR